MKLVAACLFALSLPIATAQADVIDVGGPNPDAFTISSAVNSAVSGDVIRVYPGQYSSFTVDGKSLSIIAIDTGPVTVSGVARIRSLAVDQSVELSGFSAVDSGLFQLI